MSSRWTRRQRNCVRPCGFPANAEPSRFLKIIVTEDIHAKNTRIPKEFVRRFENELCATSEVTIVVPDDRVWKMKLEKSENEVLLCKGWEEFVKYYSLKCGFFLVFKYEGNSNFSVTIFDPSAAEIYYPHNVNSENQYEDEDEIIDIDDDSALSHGKSGNKYRTGQGHLSKARQGAEEATQNSESEDSLSFTATIGQNNLKHRYFDVPFSFWKDHLCMNYPMKLQDCKGRKWEVNYVKSRPRCFRIYRGWIGFARENDLKEGDVCEFELIKRKRSYVFQVTVKA